MRITKTAADFLGTGDEVTEGKGEEGNWREP